MDGSDSWLRYTPLIPNLGSTDFSPHTNLHSATAGNKKWGLEGKEDGEPAEHVWCVCCWDNAEGDVLVQSGLEEATKPVHDTVERHSKGESAISKAFTL